MKDAKKRIFLSLLLALVLMLGGISLCLKPICAKLIRDNGIGRAVALRINDVLYEHFPQTISIDNATEIQNRMEKHPALAKISVKYLDAFANGTFSAEFPDTSAEYDVFNEEILDDLETALGFPLDLSVRQTMEQELQEKEAVVADMLFSLFSSFDRHFGRFASIALRLYGSYTSLPFRIALALIALLLIWLLWKKEGPSCLKAIGVCCIADGLILAAFLPFLLFIAAYTLTNRLIGRTAEIPVFPLFIAGGLFLAAGLLLFFLGGRRFSHPAVASGLQKV